MSLQHLHAAWLARLPKGTRIRATFELTRGDERETFELTLASTCLVSIGVGESRLGTMRAGLVPALESIARGGDASKAYAGWSLDLESLVIHEAPGSAKRSEVKKLLAPMIVQALTL